MTIQRAVGMISAHAQVHTDDALQLLRAHAFATDTTMEALARDITVHRVTLTADAALG